LTALTLYGVATNNTTLTGSLKLVTVTGGAGTAFEATVVGTNGGYGVLGSWSTPAWASGSGVGSPSGDGIFWNVTTLEGQTFPAGVWNFIASLVEAAAGVTHSADLYFPLYKYNAGVYTFIDTLVLTGQTITSTAASFTLTKSLAAVSFATGDKLYGELWADLLSHTGTPTSIKNQCSSSTTLGLASTCELDTPGYSPTGVALAATLAGVGTLAGTTTLTTALTDTFAGVGTLTGTLSAQMALTGTLAGSGTIAGTITLSTALASTLVGAGTLSGVFSLQVTLSVVFAGVGMFLPNTSGLTGPPRARALITLIAPRGKLSLQSPRGTITLVGPRGKITLEGD